MLLNQIFVLDLNLRVNKILSVGGRNSFFDDLYTIELSTGTESYEFSTNVNINEGEYVAFYYKNQYKLFTVMEVEQVHEEGDNIITTCYCECTTMQLINQVIRKFTGDINCVEFMRYLLLDSDWEVGYYSPSLARKMYSVEIERTSTIWSIIQEYIPLYNIEINPRVEIEGNRVVGQYIDLYDVDTDPIGRVTNKRFEYSRNVSGIVKTKDLSDWCTAIVIEGVDVSKTTFDVDGYTKNGDVIIDNNANEVYNRGRRPIFGIYDADEDDGTSACENALAELKERSTPHWTYEVTTAMTYREFEDINIGDEVHVVDRTYNPQLLLSARISELNISFTNPNDCSMKLANYKEISSGIRSANSIYQELLDYISKLEVGVLTQGQIQILEKYVEDIGIENEEINRIIANLKQTAYDKFMEEERPKVYGENVDITLNEGRNYYCQDIVSYIKFLAPSGCSDDYEVTLTFTTRDDQPTRIYQDNAIWLVGDSSCDVMDVVNGVLIPKCDCSYTIVVTKTDDPLIPREFVGTVTKVNNGTTEYVGFNPTTKYTEEIAPIMRSYYSNRDKFMYKQTTPYSFSNPQANADKWVTNGKYHCDCSTFVAMCCRGITYENSIYVDVNKNPYECSDTYKWSFGLGRTASDQARYCLEQGWVLDLDVTNQSDWSQLQSGDIIFWAKRLEGETNETINARFGQVGHVAIVSSINSSGMPVTYECTSMENCFYNRQLVNNYPEKLLFFARPRK